MICMSKNKERHVREQHVFVKGTVDDVFLHVPVSVSGQWLCYVSCPSFLLEKL